MGAAEDGLREAERELQSAMLAGDVGALNRLIDDRVIATGPDGRRFTKAQDLETHRSGTLVIEDLTEEELSVLVAGDTGVTVVLLALTGAHEGEEFAARLRYTRTWVRHGDDHPAGIRPVRVRAQRRPRGVRATGWCRTPGPGHPAGR